MPRKLGYKDAGDRVVVVNVHGYGLHGTVRENDGCGQVIVDLDDGRTFEGYEGIDLIYEDEVKNLPDPEVREDPKVSPFIHIDEDAITTRIGSLLSGEVY